MNNYETYPDIELWDRPMPHQDGRTYRECMQSVAGANFDMEKFIHSEMGMLKMRDAKCFILHPDVNDPEVYEYWQNFGCERIVRPGTQPGKEWITYIPKNAEGLRPLVVSISLHIYSIETSGLIQYAMQQGIYFVSPSDHSIDGVDRLVKEMKEKYPIDPERVYITGFSYGGIMATWIAYALPKVFAAVNCAGTIEPIFAPGQIEAMSEKERGRRCFGDPFSRERMATILDYALEAGKYRMPMIINSGDAEMRTTLPLNLTPDVPMGGWLTVCKRRGFNMIMRVIGHREFYFDEFDRAYAEGDPSEHAIGIFFDRTKVREIAGVTHYFGDILVEGEPLLRYIAIENLPHEQAPTSPELIWDFLKKFRRDQTSGKLLID